MLFWACATAAAEGNGAQQSGSMFDMMHKHLQETAKRMAENAAAQKITKKRGEVGLDYIVAGQTTVSICP